MNPKPTICGKNVTCSFTSCFLEIVNHINKVSINLAYLIILCENCHILENLSAK